MRALSLTATATEQISDRLGAKTLILTTGVANILVAFNTKISEAREGDFITLSTQHQYVIKAPKGKKFWYIFYKTASGTSSLSVWYFDGDFDRIA